MFEFNASVSAQVTVIEVIHLQLQPTPHKAPCQYTQLHFTVMEDYPFKVVGYFAA